MTAALSSTHLTSALLDVQNDAFHAWGYALVEASIGGERARARLIAKRTTNDYFDLQLRYEFSW